MIDALVRAKIYQPARERLAAATGRPFVTGKALASVGEGASVFVNLVAFDETACAALMALDAGDAVALAGTLKPGAWLDREGNARPAVDMVVQAVVSPYAARRKQAALQAAVATTVPGAASAMPAPARPPGMDHEDDAWLAVDGAGNTT